MERYTKKHTSKLALFFSFGDDNSGTVYQCNYCGKKMAAEHYAEYSSDSDMDWETGYCAPAHTCPSYEEAQNDLKNRVEAEDRENAIKRKMVRLEEIAKQDEITREAKNRLQSEAGQGNLLITRILKQQAAKNRDTKNRTGW